MRFVILTASRSGETRKATWSEINLDDATWSIPAERMKARRPHVVPLSKQAVAVLRIAEGLRRTNKPDEPIFPGTRGRPLSDMTLSAALRRALDEAVTVHGFRTSFRVWVEEETRYFPHVAEAALAHTVRDKTVAAYVRTDHLVSRRKMMADWGNYVSP